MAETILSPGVLQRENDSSFIKPVPTEVGAAIIGPTAKGPVEIPQLITSYSDFTTTFGTTTTYSTTTFTAANADEQINKSGETYVAYLFATLAGISKVGTYSGTGSDVNVDCGFTSGARFVLVKRTNSSGDWFVWDSTRGIVAGNDPYVLFNTTAAEVTNTDYIDPLSSGFTITSNAQSDLNTSGGTYLFLAIA